MQISDENSGGHNSRQRMQQSRVGREAPKAPFCLVFCSPLRRFVVKTLFRITKAKGLLPWASLSGAFMLRASVAPLKRALATSSRPQQASMAVQGSITSKITASLQPTHLQVINESHMHNVPKGSESHFKIVCVSEAFQGQTLIKRHRTLHGLLTEELSGTVHALSLQLKTPEEWAKTEGAVAASPACMGGSKK